jgi:hypothetical protein
MDSVILTIYYTKHVDPQRKIYQKENNFPYIKKFYNSVLKNNMNAIVFHDGLSEEFIKKYQNKNIIFCLVPNKTYGLTSMNDIRFMVYLDFLSENKSVKKVIISDIADVEFYKNVFDDITNDKLYVCYDRNRTFRHYYMVNRICQTYGSFGPFDSIADQKAVQAGLFGGSYGMVVKCLNHMKFEFENVVNKTYNTNYMVYNHVIYQNMINDSIFAKDGLDIKTKCGTNIKYLTWNT